MDNFGTEMEILKKSPKKLLEIKYMTSEMKNSISLLTEQINRNYPKFCTRKEKVE
jgi:hypothetical protein